MEKNQVSRLIALYGGRFPEYALRDIYTQLENMDFSEASIRMAQTKDPIVALLISIFLGQFGIDRFYIGDTTGTEADNMRRLWHLDHYRLVHDNGRYKK